jgi:hypothetical protein
MDNIFDNPYARAATKGFTFGLSEPVGAALASGMSYLAPQGGRPMTFQEAYAAEVAKRETERQQSPIRMSLAEMAGAVPSSVVAGMAAPLTSLKGLATLGTLGGIYGGTETGTPQGAGIGALVGGAPGLFLKYAESVPGIARELQRVGRMTPEQYAEDVRLGRMFQGQVPDEVRIGEPGRVVTPKSATAATAKPERLPFTLDDAENVSTAINEIRSNIGKLYSTGVDEKIANEAVKAMDELKFIENTIKQIKGAENIPPEVAKRLSTQVGKQISEYNKKYKNVTPTLPTLSQIQERGMVIKQLPEVDMMEIYNRYMK